METVQIGQAEARFIEEQLRLGHFGSAEEVVSAGLRLLEDSGLETWLQHVIPIRLQDHRADPASVIPMEAVFDEIERMYRADIAATPLK